MSTSARCQPQAALRRLSSAPLANPAEPLSLHAGDFATASRERWHSAGGCWRVLVGLELVGGAGGSGAGGSGAGGSGA
eukprot:13902026-Alexandrium_andersonii.AAC.1